MTFPTVIFDKIPYRITDPDPAWFQRSPDDLPECSQCGDALTFTFPSRVEPQTAGFAGSYSVPTGIRCNCFLVNPGSAQLVYHEKLVRDPVPIVPV